MDRRKFIISTSATLVGITTGALYWPIRWNYIVIHHSGGSYGNIPFLKKVHRERQGNDPIDAIPYHYVIGNGNGLGLGEIAHGWRESYNVWGAHVSGNNLDRNVRGIGICLIGNFEKVAVPDEQYLAAVKLTRKLREKYAIPLENIAGHGYIPGESTKCPGRHFPMEKFLLDIT